MVQWGGVAAAGSVYFFRQWHECFDFAQQWNKWLFLTFSAVVCLWLSLNDVLGWGLQREERERGAGLCNGYWREPGAASRAGATGAVFAMLNYQSFSVVSLAGGSFGRELLPQGTERGRWSLRVPHVQSGALDK